MDPPNPPRPRAQRGPASGYQRGPLQPRHGDSGPPACRRAQHPSPPPPRRRSRRHASIGPRRTAPWKQQDPLDRPTTRLRTLGRTAAMLHAITLIPTPELPRRDRPIASVDFAALRRQQPPNPLLIEAEQRTAASRLDDPYVFIHGDLWQGNALWRGNTLTGLIDWDCAGTGAPGIDLGSLRCDAAICFGLEAADDIQHGWEEVAGRPASDVRYWDIVAALSTPPDMGWFPAAIAGQGRPDLTPGGTATAPRRVPPIRTLASGPRGRVGWRDQARSPILTTSVPFAVVAVQQPLRGPAADLGGQLPAQVERVLDAWNQSRSAASLPRREERLDTLADRTGGLKCALDGIAAVISNPEAAPPAREHDALAQ